PIAGANAITSPNRPIAVPRFSLGKVKNSIVCINGIIIPAPAACKTRPINSIEKSIPTAQSNVPTAKILIAVKNNCLDVKRSIKNAVTGIIIPFTNINIDCNHCTVLSDTWRSFIIGGKAVPSKVWFKLVIKAPDNRTINRGILFSTWKFPVSVNVLTSFLTNYTSKYYITLNVVNLKVELIFLNLSVRSLKYCHERVFLG